MRRFLGGLFVLMGLVVVPPALFMEGAVGDVMPIVGFALFLTGIAFMARRPSDQEIAERMVQKDLIGTAVVLGGLIGIAILIVAVSRLLF